MSPPPLVCWIDRLLFGSRVPLGPVPPSLEPTVQELASRGLSVRDVAINGGLVRAAADLEADLAALLAHLERVPRSARHPAFRTRSAASLYNRLLPFLEPPRPTTTELPPVPRDPTDREILDVLLRGDDRDDAPLPFRDARYWGELARDLLRHRRPPSGVARAPVPPSDLPVLFEDLHRLYDATCGRMGRIVPPLRMVLVPRGDHVDPVHLASVPLLRAFVASRPRHGLARALGSVLGSLLEDWILHARSEPSLMSPRLLAFLHNVRVVHERVRDVEGENVPPRLVDVFQRLLTLAGKDELWSDDVGPPEKEEEEPAAGCLGHDVLRLRERVLQLENQEGVLFQLLETASSNRTTCSEQRVSGRT